MYGTSRSRRFRNFSAELRRVTVLPRQPVAVVGVQPVDRLERAELHPAGVEVVGQLGPARLGSRLLQSVGVAADVMADRGQSGRRRLTRRVTDLVRNVAQSEVVSPVKCSVVRLSAQGPSAPASSCRSRRPAASRTPGRRRSRARPRCGLVGVLLVDPRVPGHAGQAGDRVVAAPVQPPQIVAVLPPCCCADQDRPAIGRDHRSRRRNSRHRRRRRNPASTCPWRWPAPGRTADPRRGCSGGC